MFNPVCLESTGGPDVMSGHLPLPVVHCSQHQPSQPYFINAESILHKYREGITVFQVIKNTKLLTPAQFMNSAIFLVGNPKLSVLLVVIC